MSEINVVQQPPANVKVSAGPPIAPGTIDDDDVAADAGIAESKIAGLVADLAARPTLTAADARYEPLGISQIFAAATGTGVGMAAISQFGLTTGGVAYFDPAGAAVGETALLLFDDSGFGLTSDGHPYFDPTAPPLALLIKVGN